MSLSQYNVREASRILNTSANKNGLIIGKLLQVSVKKKNVTLKEIAAAKKNNLNNRAIS